MKRFLSQLLLQKNQERIVALGLFVLLVILLLPLLMIARYNVMAVDDFMYLNIAQNGLHDGQNIFGVLLAQMKNTYDCWRTWQGQYFVNWMIMAFLALFGPENYNLVIVVTLLALLLAELYLAHIVLRKGFGATFSQMCIVIFPVMIYHMSVPASLVEAYYWLSGAITYTTTYAISLVMIGMLVDLFISNSKRKWQVCLMKLMVILLSACLGGSNFITGLFILLVFVLFAGYSIFKKHKYRIFCIVNLVVFTSCFLITVFSPGATNRRLDNAEAQVPALEAIALSLYEAAKFIWQWSLPFVILLMLALLPMFLKLARKTSFSFPFPLLVLFISFGMYAAQFTPNQYALGILGAYRVQNIYRFQMLFWLLGNEMYIVGYIHRRFPELRIPFADKLCKLPFATVIYGLAATCTVFFCMYYYAGSTMSSVSAYYSLRDGSAEGYYQEYLDRLEVLKDDAVKDAVFEPYHNRPYALFFDDFQISYNWINEDAAEYYGKESISLKVE